jgi:hypothetical protein
VRADESLAGTKILMLTAKGRDTDVAQGLGLGADAYMTKPFSTKDLAARVRRCWAARREGRPRESRRPWRPAVVLALWAWAVGRPSSARWTSRAQCAAGDAGKPRGAGRDGLDGGVHRAGWLLTRRPGCAGGRPPARLAEQAQVLAGSDMQRELALPGERRVCRRCRPSSTSWSGSARR